MDSIKSIAGAGMMSRLDLPVGYYDLPPGWLVNLVTCLEMQKRPAIEAAQWPAGFTLKKLGRSDTALFRQVFRLIGEDLLWFSRLIMPETELADILGHRDVEAFALMKDGVAVGLLELNFRNMPDCELAFFGVAPQLVGTGAGRNLMREALTRAWARPINRLWVHTCHYDHPKALSFYIKVGFMPYKLMIEVHDDPRLSGHLPLTAASHVPLLNR